MTRVLSPVLLALGLLVAGPVLASDGVALQDDDEEDLLDDDQDEESDEEEDLLGEDEPLVEETEEERARREAEEEKRRLDEADRIDLEDEGIEELDELELDEEQTGEDLLEDEIREDVIGGEGQDTARIYRDYQDRVDDYLVDEEIIAWERYLKKYPNTLFRDRIEERMEELMEELYATRIERQEDRRLDADRREIPFAQALLLENLNPRTRLQAGFEWGLPDYMNLLLDYEHQIRRELSVHGGVRNRYTGWSFEAGARWAFVKSSRTKTLVVLLGDLHFNGNPAFLGIRPQLGFGKKFGDLDVQLQGGIDIDTRPSAPPVVLGGGNVTYSASENVAAFLETNLYMKNVAWEDGGSFRFNLATFGIKFYPRIEGMELGKMEVNVGASVPYTSNYWMYHFGSIMAQLNYYM